MSAAGRFITLEGGEGVGKSTQLAALADALRAHGLDPLITREPGGSEGAEAIRTLLLEGEAGRWGPRAEALLFAAARAVASASGSWSKSVRSGSLPALPMRWSVNMSASSSPLAPL